MRHFEPSDALTSNREEPLSRLRKLLFTGLALLALGAVTAMSPAPASKCHTYTVCKSTGECKPTEDESESCLGIFNGGSYCEPGCAEN